VIKIRYSDLPAGLHASTETEGRHTIIYLVPGLSAADRKNAIDRLRASSRVGHGPKLAAIPLALALITDRIRQNLRNGAAAARMHPTGVAIPLIAFVCGAVLYALFVTGSIRIGPPSIAESAPNPIPPGATAPAKVGETMPDVTVGGRGNTPVYSSDLTGVQRTGASAGSTGPAGRTPGSGSSPTSTGTPTPTSSGHPTPPGTPTSPVVPPNSSSPTPTPTHTRPGGGGGGGGLCIDLGILGICI
jgi:hypothetical protein